MNILSEIKPNGHITIRIDVKEKQIDSKYISCNSRTDLNDLKLDNYFEISNLIKKEKRRNSSGLIPIYNSKLNQNWFLQLEIKILNSEDYK